MLDKLFEPVNIGNVEIKNRIVMTAMHLNYTPDGKVNDKLIAFYRERAKGGTGLIIVGGCIIDDYSGMRSMIDIRTDDTIEGHRRLTEDLHKYDAKVACQLYQAGRYAHSFAIDGKQAVSASAVFSSFTKETPRPLEIEEIKEIVLNYATAATRAKKAGYDMVEVLGGAGYLISQFLSPVTNLREDEYGGSWENRMRFGLEVAEAVRETVGKDYPVMFRIAGHDFMQGGNTNKEAADFARHLERMGIDCINVTGGWHETRVPQLPMNMPRGAYVFLAANIRKGLGVPVVACNRINDPFLAEEVLRGGMADLVGMARSLIADPYMPEKAKLGYVEEINHCIACNQGCFDNVFYLQPVTCTVNPRAGREDEIVIEEAEKKKKVAVVGGGCAGMKAAAVAASRGHAVTLFERSDILGGQLNLAAVPPGREEFFTLIEDLEKQLEILDVSVETDTEVEREMLEERGFDTVIIATGAMPACPPIQGIDGPHVVQSWDVLAGDEDLNGNNVVIIGGGAVGAETAIYIASIGTIDGETLKFLIMNNADSAETLEDAAFRGVKKVTILEMMDKIGKDVGLSTRWTLLQDLRSLGIETIKAASAKRIEEDKVIVETKDGEAEIECDQVVLACGSESDGSLAESLKGSSFEVHIIGDAAKPRKAIDAIREAVEIASGL